jgi:hypothetical protein
MSSHNSMARVDQVQELLRSPLGSMLFVTQITEPDFNENRFLYISSMLIRVLYRVIPSILLSG